MTIFKMSNFAKLRPPRISNIYEIWCDFGKISEPFPKKYPFENLSQVICIIIKLNVFTIEYHNSMPDPYSKISTNATKSKPIMQLGQPKQHIKSYNHIDHHHFFVQYKNST